MAGYKLFNFIVNSLDYEQLILVQEKVSTFWIAIENGNGCW